MKVLKTWNGNTLGLDEGLTETHKKSPTIRPGLINI
jgi:hypothetical protein